MEIERITEPLKSSIGKIGKNPVFLIGAVGLVGIVFLLFKNRGSSSQGDQQSTDNGTVPVSSVSSDGSYSQVMTSVRDILDQNNEDQNAEMDEKLADLLSLTDTMIDDNNAALSGIIDKNNATLSEMIGSTNKDLTALINTQTSQITEQLTKTNEVLNTTVDELADLEDRPTTIIQQITAPAASTPAPVPAASTSSVSSGSTSTQSSPKVDGAGRPVPTLEQVIPSGGPDGSGWHSGPNGITQDKNGDTIMVNPKTGTIATVTPGYEDQMRREGFVTRVPNQ